MVPETSSPAQGSRSALKTVFDAIEPIRSAGIDARPIAVFLCRRLRFAQAPLALPSQPT
jgi:hypothetical protein